MLNKTGEYRRVNYKAFQGGVLTSNVVIPGLRKLPAWTDINARHAEVWLGLFLLLFFYTEF